MGNLPINMELGYVRAYAHRQDELQQNHTKTMLVAQFCFLRPKSTPRWLEIQKFFIHTKIIHIFCCAPEINSLRGWHVNVSSAQIEQIHISPDDKSGVFHKKEVILTWRGTHLFRVKNICSARIQLIGYLRSGRAKKFTNGLAHLNTFFTMSLAHTH